MQLRDPEPTSSSAEATGLSGAQPSSLVAGDLPACPVLALSDDPLLLEALAGATQSAAPVSAAPSPDRFIDQLVAIGAGVALIDAACVSSPLKPFLIGLREQFPQLLLMLTGPAQLQAQFSPQLEDGTIFRFVHKPASSQRLRLFLDAAARHLTAESPLPEIRATRAVRSAPPERTSGRRGIGRAVLLGMLLAVGVAAWLVWQHPIAGSAHPSPATDSGAAAPVSAPVPSEPAGPATISTDQAAELAAREAAAREQAARGAAALEQAQRSAQGARADQVNLYVQLVRKRLASGALIEPADDSAHSYLASAQALAPEDPEVRALSLALGEAMISRFRHALVVGDSIEAQRWLQACSDYRVGSATLNELTNELAQLQTAQRAPTSPAGPPPVAVPATNSAVAPSAPSASSPPAAPATAAAASSQPIASSQPESGAAPASSPASAAPNAAAAPGTTDAPSMTAASAPATPPTVAATVAAPQPASPAADAVVSEGSLTRVLFVRPTYPEAALVRGITGWVDLEFTVTAEGKVGDITVLASEPNGVFERAARSALERSRYRPVMRNGVAVAQRTRIRVRFQQ